MKGIDFKEKWPDYCKRHRLKIGDEDVIYWANGLKILRRTNP